MLTRDGVLLIAIDLQDGLLPKISGADMVIEMSIKLIRFMRALELPIICTEQYPKGLGLTTERVAQEIEGVPRFSKVSFGCFGVPEFAHAVSASGRKQLLVVGIEAHVCVMQTVLAGVESGYEVYVARDAIGSRFVSDCDAGIARMNAHGAEIVTTEMAIFEILRAAGTPEFKKVLPLLK